MTNASGLAADIRGSVDSSTFDLAGQNVGTITTNITQAFKDPLPVSSMIRITFVTGAGKLGRQKYDADAAKAVTSALRDLGFEEDRGASCVNECAGSYKLQHDTGKNLKTVVVFPRITEEPEADTKERNGSGLEEGIGNLLIKGSVEDMIMSSSFTVFENMLKSKCPSWSEKKGCLAALSNIRSTFDELEQKLLVGTVLTDGEQQFYDSVSVEMVDKKQSLVKDLMHKQVEEGDITNQEKKQLLSQVQDRLETIINELALADGKKIENLQTMQKKMETRKDMLSKISPKPPHKLRHEDKICALKAELQPLLELEAGASGRLLSLKESKSLARKEQIVEEIATLESDSRGWFEDDESFSNRLDLCNENWSKRKKETSKRSGGKSPAINASANAWMTSSSSKPKPNARSAVNTAKKGKGGTGNAGGVFAAMMLDSDSD